MTLHITATVERWPVDGQFIIARGAKAEALKNLGVALIEQPLPAANDAALGGISAPLPIFADESCHVAADVARLHPSTSSP